MVVWQVDVLEGRTQFFVFPEGVTDGLFHLGVQALSKVLPGYADLQAIGFKKSKEYDVEGLTGADSAYFGFWGLDPYDRKDYELRFFPTHSDAVELGTALADERIGENARLDEDTANWPVGLRDARRCTGGKAYSGPQNCKTPKYWGYSIYTNKILVCSGTDLGTAQIQCNELPTALEPQADAAWQLALRPVVTMPVIGDHLAVPLK